MIVEKLQYPMYSGMECANFKHPIFDAYMLYMQAYVLLVHRDYLLYL